MLYSTCKNSQEVLDIQYCAILAVRNDESETFLPSFGNTAGPGFDWAKLADPWDPDPFFKKSESIFIIYFSLNPDPKCFVLWIRLQFFYLFITDYSLIILWIRIHNVLFFKPISIMFCIWIRIHNVFSFNLDP